MKIDGNSLRTGYVIRHQDRLWRVMKTQHVKPGKGGAFMQVELRAVDSGTKLKTRFRSADTVERVRLEQNLCQFLFSDGSMYTFMDQETYEQTVLPEDLLDEQAQFLADGMVVTIESLEGQPLSVRLPDHVTQTVTEADAVVKGQTATSSYKPALLDNGVRVMVPPYIEAGTRIVVNTQTQEFVERARD